MPSNLYLLLIKWNKSKINKLVEKIKKNKSEGGSITEVEELRRLQYELRVGLIKFNEYLYKFFYWQIPDSEAKKIRKEINHIKKENDKYGPTGIIREKNGMLKEIDHEDFMRRTGITYNIFRDYLQKLSEERKNIDTIWIVITTFLKNEAVDIAIIGTIITTIWTMINLYIEIRRRIKKIYHRNKNHH